MQPPKLSLTPPRAPALARAYWLVIALLAFTGTGFAAVELAGHITVKQTRIYSGVLEGKSAPLPVVLPAGLPLQKMLVTEGQSVAKDQKIARLDTVALTDLSKKLRETLSLKQIEYRCLQDSLTPRAEAPRKSAAAENTSDHSAQRQIILDQCDNRRRSDLIAHQQLLHKHARLRREGTLALQELLARIKTAAPEVRDILTLRAALEKETLHGEIRKLELEIAALKEGQRKRTLTALATLDDEKIALQLRLLHLKTWSSAPWIVAPVAGRISHLRPLAPSMSSPEDQTLARIHHADMVTYKAYFNLPASQAKALKQGDRVAVSLSGLAPSLQSVEGRVKEIQFNHDPKRPLARVFVSLDTNNITQSGRSLILEIPEGTRSTLHVSLPDDRFSAVISRSMSSLLDETKRQP